MPKNTFADLNAQLVQFVSFLDDFTISLLPGGNLSRELSIQIDELRVKASDLLNKITLDLTSSILRRHIMKQADKISDTRAEQALFLTKIIHRMREDLDQVQQYAKVAILPDPTNREILDRVSLNLEFFLTRILPKPTEKEATTLPETTGKTLCSHVDGYLFLLDDIRDYMRKRGVWTERARLLIGEIRKKSFDLSQLIPLD